MLYFVTTIYNCEKFKIIFVWTNETIFCFVRPFAQLSYEPVCLKETSE